MSITNVLAGKKLPEDINVIIEISANSFPIKYEIDKKNGVLFLDRFLPTTMFYPFNYGYINQTLSKDGDPIDVLVPTTYPIQSGSVIRCRPIGALEMIDESGEDDKIIAVPHQKISKEYNYIKDIDDLSESIKNKILYFFKHYKDLEEKKWIKINGWSDVESAKEKITSSFVRAKKKK